MRVTFFASSKPREKLLADAFATGARCHGDEVVIRELDGTAQVADTEVVAMVGVKSREIFDANVRAGVKTIMFDKGYIRARADSPIRIWEYWRVAVDGHHPTKHLSSMNCGPERWEKFGLEPLPWRQRGEHIVFAGSSEKYHNFYGMGHPTRYARKALGSIREYSDRRVIYRPKPSWAEARAIRGADYSKPPETINEVLRGAHALVTHGSNACFEAVLLGVPCVILGDAVAKPISSTNLADIEAPRLATDDERMQWLYNLANLQWTMAEMASGQMWTVIRNHVYA